MQLNLKRMCFQASLIVIPIWLSSSMHTASADDARQQLNAAATKRLNELKLAEDRLKSDIDICNQQIDAYKKILDSRESDLAIVREKIKSIEVAFRWL